MLLYQFSTYQTRQNSQQFSHLVEVVVVFLACKRGPPRSCWDPKQICWNETVLRNYHKCFAIVIFSLYIYLHCYSTNILLEYCYSSRQLVTWCMCFSRDFGPPTFCLSTFCPGFLSAHHPAMLRPSSVSMESVVPRVRIFVDEQTNDKLERTQRKKQQLDTFKNITA